MKRYLSVFLALLVVGLLVSPPALAYVGPGSGITAIGAALAFIGAIFFAIFGFLWYPIKRLWRVLSGSKAKTKPTADNPDP